MEDFGEYEGMHYEGNCIRPPSEADSILLQVTLGCSHNKCTFCGTYKDKRFTIKDTALMPARIVLKPFPSPLQAKSLCRLSIPDTIRYAISICAQGLNAVFYRMQP